MKKNAEYSSLVRHLSKVLVTELAQNELDLFDEFFDEYSNNNCQNKKIKEGDSDDPLGFGLSDTLIETSPAIFASVTAVLTYIITIVLQVSENLGEDVIKEKISKLFKTNTDNNRGMSEVQLKTIRNIAFTTAKRFELGDDDAKKLADCLIGTIATKRFEK